VRAGYISRKAVDAAQAAQSRMELAMSNNELPELPQAITSLKDQRWTGPRGTRHVLERAETIKVGDHKGQMPEEVARELLALGTAVPADSEKAKAVQTSAKLEKARKAKAGEKAKAADRDQGKGKDKE